MGDCEGYIVERRSGSEGRGSRLLAPYECDGELGDSILEERRECQISL